MDPARPGAGSAPRGDATPPAYSGSAAGDRGPLALLDRVLASVDLGFQLAASALAGLLTTAIWALAGGGYFWPAWIWLAVCTPLALRVWLSRAREIEDPLERRFARRAVLCGIVVGFEIIVWALAGGGYFWPVWPLLGLSAALAVNALVAFRDRLPTRARRIALSSRVDELARTRRGALDVQASELRRIERDLHDGAQARLVALSMQLGRAEERLADRPEEALLVRRAREEAGAAIAELRDLARGIAPPVLADRGLAAAAESLGQRSPARVAVAASLQRRPPPVVETAGYFVIAESLTNVAKHAPGASTHVAIACDDERLVVEIADDGPGGADAGGAGLTGLRHRVEALDGTLRVASPPGGPTTIHAELPCGS